MLRDSWTYGGRAVIVLALAAANANTASASGVGASIYVQTAPRRVVQQASYESAPMAAPVAGHTAGHPNRFADMHQLGISPCDAGGNCIPNAPFGYTQPRWRRWPGTATQAPRPQLADELEEEDLTRPFDPPAPEEEDKQAPPPIDDVEEDRGDAPLNEEIFEPAIEAPGGAGGLELELPPLPQRPLPQPPRPVIPQVGEPPAGMQPPARVQPPAPRQDGPPGLPFGWRPAGSGGQLTEPRAVDALPAETPFTTRPTSLPRPTAEDAPPALPAGFTAVQPNKLLRRLPRLLTGSREPRRRDPAVVPVAAFAPVQ